MILIVDDDSAIRKSLLYLLNKAGYEAVAVPSAEEALAALREQEPDLILMDMNFSLATTGEEGLRLLAKAKRLRPHVPVILMTA